MNDKSIQRQRVLNMAIATVGLVAVAPLMAVIAVVIKFTSKGPIIYKQTRVGINRRSLYGQPRSNLERRTTSRLPNESIERRNGWYVGAVHRRVKNIGGIPFTMYKFRTMVVSEKNMPEQWAKQNDARVTLVGRILRKYRLDELPQLFNVLLGDMNVVGPRPEQPIIFSSLRDSIFGYDIRQRSLPGITGLAQISQHYDTCIEDVKRKLIYDIKYVSEPSASKDLKIMLKTIPAVLLNKGGW